MPITIPFDSSRLDDRIVISGIGMITSVGNDRETVWNAVRSGKSGVQSLRGFLGIPDGAFIGAPVLNVDSSPGELKVVSLCRAAAAEALADARVFPNDPRVDRTRFGCMISAHFGDTAGLEARIDPKYDTPRQGIPWWHQWLPNTACAGVAGEHELYGPRSSHSTACASGLVDFLSAVWSIRGGQCDLALCGSAEAIHPLFLAGFQAMRVLANHDDPKQACRPFDRSRSGFVIGEGGAMFVVERLSHALRRNAPIYAEVLAGRLLSEAHHVTGLDANSDVLCNLITTTLKKANIAPDDIAYINAHGTGTQQNDPAETRGIRRAFGSAAERTCISSCKSMIGHLVNAAGGVELAITVLALRDGFAPPTLNLTDPDPDCDLDCIPLVGRRGNFEHAMKLSVAFGGHLAAVALRRWESPSAQQIRPLRKAA